MAAFSDAGRVGIWGRSGSGKSTLAKRLVAKRKRVVAFDPQDEYQHERGFFRVDTIDQVRAYMARNWRRNFKVAYVPPAGQEMAALDRLSKLLKIAQKPFFDGEDERQITLLAEELNEPFPVTSIPKAYGGFGDLCSRGRHYGIELIGVSQRVAEVNTRFRGNCTETYVFRQKGPRDLTAAANELGDVKPADIQALKPHHYIHEKDGTITYGKN
ncbi:helicase HerA domain-containing protein [Thalassospira sp. SM2505]